METFVWPVLAQAAPRLLDHPEQDSYQALLAPENIGLLLFLVGWLLFGVASLRARVLPRWAAALVLTMFEDDDSVFAALRAGARGYLLKGAMKAEILRAVRAVSYFAAPPPSLPEYAFPELTGREREILDLLAEQQTNQEIAHRLQVSLKTVRNHVSNIFSKLQVADRAQAILRARQAGLGERQREQRSQADR
jgi:DNA-binding NarL/FixJ family response regulator